MKLMSAQVTNFRSVEDSEKFELGDLTCLVGKNEAGKTAVLQALYGLNPFKNFQFDKTRDYPRRRLSKFTRNHPNEESKVITTYWELNEDEIEILEGTYVANILTSKIIKISFGIGYKGKIWDVEVDEKKYLDNCMDRFSFNVTEKAKINKIQITSEVVEVLESYEGKTEKQNQLLAEIKKFRKNKLTLSVIDKLNEMMPTFFYTSHYERMSGEVSFTKLALDRQQDTLSIGDEIFLDFLEYAGTTIEELQESEKFEELKAKCEGASNDITDEIFDFWSQNEALQVQIDLGEGKPQDAPPFNTGTVAKIRIYNQHHRASVPLSERSAGFVWFFSFLAQFKQLQAEAGNAIILLDEPGLTLHGKAQSDLLRYIEERLLPDHQVIYTTHSPFMVPAGRLSDVRVVEDVIGKDSRGKVIVHGTKVSSDVLSVDKDTLFPLQGHLGYEITQSLFIGKNTLLVEGPSDVLYLQALSSALNKRAREGLNPDWVICPTGGIDKVMSFASLFSGNNLNIAVLCDYAHGDKRKVQRLRESQILKTNHVLTVADFTEKSESDIEDIFTPDLYCTIVNDTYKLTGKNKITIKKLEDVMPKTERLVKQVESLFNVMPADVSNFDHFAPSDYLIRNPSILARDSKDVTSTLDVAEKIFSEINRFLNG